MDNIEVTFEWDPGDRSVGISAGWGADTGASVTAHGITTIIAFIVDDRVDPAEWEVDQIDVSVADANVGVIYDPQQGWPRQPLKLGAMVDVCNAVTAEWQRILEAQEAAAEAEAEALYQDIS